MDAQFRKIDRQYVLSDSSVNEYGFRLLTSGYQLDEYRKNPIGYYMHRREDGIVLKWEDLCVENDTLLGKPVINLANDRGAQTWTEAENGFLNAASVGHIVILDFSNDPELMLPGQTGPTITRWYNKECSLVDIPGNSNALARLYDAQENEITLADFAQGKIGNRMMTDVGNVELIGLLGIDASAPVSAIVERVQLLLTEKKDLEEKRTSYAQELEHYKELVSGIEKQKKQAEVVRLLEQALEGRKITVALRAQLQEDYLENPEGLKRLLAAMPGYRSIASLLRAGSPDVSEADWTWDDYEKNDPAGVRLTELKANDPDRYRNLFDAKFNS